MAYRVNLTTRAQRDLSALHDTIDGPNSAAAQKWYTGLKQAILSLQNQPDRCPPAPESPGLRHFLYGRKPHIYRIIYRVLERPAQVDILHIRHGAMSEPNFPLKP